MALRIEDYALISDETTVALVGRDGSIDWLCLPEIDSSACFAALLGAPENGRWLIAPRGEVTATSRRYLGPTMILETEFTTEEGRVAVIDFMPIVERGGPQSDLIRIVEGREGAVPMCTDLVVRFGYGRVVPWVQHDGQSMFAIAGSQAVELDSPVQLEGHDLRSTAEFVVEAGARVPFILTHYISYGQKPTPARCRDGAAHDRAVLDGVGRPLCRHVALARAGRALALDPEVADPRAFGRHRRRRHLLAAGGAGRRGATGITGSAGSGMPP